MTLKEFDLEGALMFVILLSAVVLSIAMVVLVILALVSAVL